jgi:hypothetical protein
MMNRIVFGIAVIVVLVFLWGEHLASSDKKEDEKAKDASAALGIYTDEGSLIVGVWADGRIIWSGDQVRGGTPYYGSMVEQIRVNGLLQSLKRDGVFENRRLTRAWWGPEGNPTIINLRYDGAQLKMASWHEGAEASGKVIATHVGLESMSAGGRLTALEKEPAEYLYFRFVWNEVRWKVSQLLPCNGQTIAGKPIIQGGKIAWANP